MTETILNADGEVDLLLCSPDGEPRGLLARVGDIFPLDPSGDLRSGGSGGGQERFSSARPWGLRFLQVPQSHAGKHEGTAQATTGTVGDDSQGGEDWTND